MGQTLVLDAAEPAAGSEPAEFRPGLVSVPGNPVPAGATLQWLDNAGVQLRCARWPATAREVRGTVCLIHGRSEYIEKYYEVISDLRRRGFAVLTFDFRGQGGSDRLLRQPERSHVDHFSDYVSDLEIVMSEILLPECPAPFYALAHSMGGTVMLHSLDKGRLVFDRVVLTAPMIGLARRRPKLSALARIVRFLNGFGLGERRMPFSSQTDYETMNMDRNTLTSDPDRFQNSVRLLRKAPFLKIGSPTVGWVHAACQAMLEFQNPEFAFNNRTPVLVVASGSDEVVSLAAIEKLASAMRSLWHIVVPGARHEILQERDLFRDQFWAAFDAFIPGTDI